MEKLINKVENTIKEIEKIQILIQQGLAKPEEKQRAFEIAKETADLFTDDTLKRKVEKEKKQTYWSTQTHDGFVNSSEANQLNGWLDLLKEYKEKKKIKSELSSENIHIKSIVDGDDQHIFITEKGSSEHAHLILDGETGEIRIDPKDKDPHGVIKSIKAELELKTGEFVQITKSSLNFVEPQKPSANIKVYTASKDGYSVLEIYNNGDEDLENFEIKITWTQPDGQQERILNEFNTENDYLVLSTPKSLNILKQGEKIYAINIPSISVDKKIKVEVSCTGTKTNKLLAKEFVLETHGQYK